MRGLYAITAGGNTTRSELLEQVRQAISGGARIVQYRDKSCDVDKRVSEADALNQLCRDHQIPLIINDDVKLAARVEAAGVHVGKDDAALTEAREQLGPDAIIGVSCYNRFDLAEAAVSAGADYVAFGAFFISSTKPKAVPASPDLLVRARAELGRPVVAIGGITPENGASLISAGADMLAVVSGIFAQTDITFAARRYADLFPTD